MIGAIHTFGDLIHWPPHIHALVSEGVFLPNSYQSVNESPQASNVRNGVAVLRGSGFWTILSCFDNRLDPISDTIECEEIERIRSNITKPPHSQP